MKRYILPILAMVLVTSMVSSAYAPTAVEDPQVLGKLGAIKNHLESAINLLSNVQNEVARNSGPSNHELQGQLHVAEKQLTRLDEQNGIFYFFEHSSSGHNLVGLPAVQKELQTILSESNSIKSIAVQLELNPKISQDPAALSDLNKIIDSANAIATTVTILLEGPTITIEKDTVGGVDGTFSFVTNSTISSFSITTTGGTGTQKLEHMPNNIGILVRETGSSVASSLTSITCTSISGSNVIIVNTPDKEVDLNLGSFASQVKCVFVNTITPGGTGGTTGGT